MTPTLSLKTSSWALFACVSLIASSCAETDAPLVESTPDAGVARDASMSRDLSRPDLSTGTNTSKDMSTDSLDMSMEVDMKGVCEQGMKRCKDENTAQVCDDSGAWQDDACTENTECKEGACVQGAICTEGERRCFDAKTAQVCRPGGLAYATETCSGDTSCYKGMCASGAPNGDTCAMNGDCLSGLCHCTAAESCPKEFTGAYCTDKCDSNADCAQNEVCLNTEVHAISSQVGNYAHCVPKCAGACSTAGQSCQWVPTKETASDTGWAQACYFSGAKEVGEACASDDVCLGGECTTKFFMEGFCSGRCEQTGCPDNMVCAELTAGEFWCTIPCESDVCPLDIPVDRLEVTCKRLNVSGGPKQSVCTRT